MYGYTGAAGWMYRAGIEGILGLRVRGDVLSIDPAIPRAWPSYEAVLRHGAAQYTITVENPHGATRGVAEAELDGTPVPLPAGGAVEFALAEEGLHRIRVVLGEPG